MQALKAPCQEVAAAKTLIDIDEDLLAEASVALGASTEQDTVTHALRVVVEEARQRRRQALARLRQVTDEGVFDFDRLASMDD